MSSEFYHNLLNPFHGFNFSTANIDFLPVVALPVLDDVVPLTSTRKHLSWGEGNSTEVFKRAVDGCNVKMGTRVRQMRFDTGASQGAMLHDDQGGVEHYDRVVFACPATAASAILRDGSWVERSLLQGVSYQDDFGRDDWADWLEVPVHQDCSILPEAHRDVIAKELAFIVDVDVQEGGGIEYDHCLGAWSPTAKAAGVHGADMFVTQCKHPRKEIDESKVIGTFSAPRAHPAMCFRNMLITQLLPLVQGRRGVYFCSNWSVAGNGHDLSLLAGICCASAIGADYPFEDRDAARDHDLLRRFMRI